MKSRLMGLLVFLFLLVPGRLSAQGIFEAFGFPKTVTATGHTEVVGGVMVSLRLGTTTSGTLVVDLSPLRITNTNAVDIRVAATGMTVGAVTIDAEKGLIRLPVFAGAASGSIRIDGIRVSVAGTGITSLNARLSWEDSLNIFNSATSVNVVNAVQSGLAADPITDRWVVFNGQLFDNTSKISLREGYARAFSDSAEFGQTVSTRIRIRVTDYPANVQMFFPASVTSPESGATLTTLEGGPVTLPKGNGTTELTYRFSGVATSNDLVESFEILFTVALTGVPGTTQPTVEHSLAPIGAAVPDATFPSTDVPRYAEDNIVVQEGSSRIITKVLYWTGADASLGNRVTIFNGSSRSANLTIDALNSSGQAVSGAGITNPVKTSLLANQSLVRTVSELFGSASGISSIRIQSASEDVLASVQVSGAGKAESVPFLTRPVANFFVPVVSEGAQLNLMNPNSSAATGTLTLRTEQGRLVSTQSVQLPALASTSVSLGTAFNNPASGYVFASFSLPVIPFESFGDSNTLNMLGIQPGASVASLYIPFFAVGNGFDTDVNLINTSDETVTLRAQVFDSAGSPGTSASIVMPPSEQLSRSIQRIFSQVPATGYVRFDVPQLFKGFFSFYPVVTGHARIRSSQGGSTVLQLSAYPLQDSFILESGPGAGEFQGIAVVNPNSVPVVVTLQAMNSFGAVISNASLTLNPGQVTSRLTSQLFAAELAPQSVIRVTSSAPIVATAIIGSNGLDVLRSLPVVR